MTILLLIAGALLGLIGALAFSTSNAPVAVSLVCMSFFGLCLLKLPFAVATR